MELQVTKKTKKRVKGWAIAQSQACHEASSCSKTYSLSEVPNLMTGKTGQCSFRHKISSAMLTIARLQLEVSGGGNGFIVDVSAISGL